MKLDQKSKLRIEHYLELAGARPDSIRALEITDPRLTESDSKKIICGFYSTYTIFEPEKGFVCRIGPTEVDYWESGVPGPLMDKVQEIEKKALRYKRPFLDVWNREKYKVSDWKVLADEVMEALAETLGKLFHSISSKAKGTRQ